MPGQLGVKDLARIRTHLYSRRVKQMAARENTLSLSFNSATSRLAAGRANARVYLQSPPRSRQSAHWNDKTQSPRTAPLTAGTAGRLAPSRRVNHGAPTQRPPVAAATWWRHLRPYNSRCLAKRYRRAANRIVQDTRENQAHPTGELKPANHPLAASGSRGSKVWWTRTLPVTSAIPSSYRRAMQRCAHARPRNVAGSAVSACQSSPKSLAKASSHSELGHGT